MTTIQKIIIAQIAISFTAFALLFYSYAGESGGDMAIIMFNLIAGILQMVFVSIYFTIRKANVLSPAIAAIILSQVTELTIFAQWGHPINDLIKNFKY